MIAAAGVLTGCHPAPDDTGSTLDWTTDIAPQLRRDCAACHLDGFASGGLALDGAPDTLIDAPSRAELPYIVLGAPDDSYLLHKLQGTQADVGGFGAQMPLGVPWSEPELAVLAAWIAEGPTGR